MRWALIVLALSAGAAGNATAERSHRPFVVVNQESGVPVFADDIADRPYDIVGPIKAHVRKATIFSPAASRAKIYRELWERAEKLGADAVIKATYGRSHVNAISWGSTTAEGIAIRFRAPPSAPN